MKMQIVSGQQRSRHGPFSSASSAIQCFINSQMNSKTSKLKSNTFILQCKKISIDGSQLAFPFHCSRIIDGHTSCRDCARLASDRKPFSRALPGTSLSKSSTHFNYTLEKLSQSGLKRASIHLCRRAQQLEGESEREDGAGAS